MVDKELHPKPVNISIILCTYNRSQSLAKALDSVAASVLPSSITWEVLVIDNNSNDQTRDVVEDFRRRYPGRFRYLLETQQGKSFALNTGIRQVQSDVLAFVDDDAIVEPTWLQNLTAPLLGGEWAGSGGRILPDGAFSPPRWFAPDERSMLAVLALFDLGPAAGQLTEPPFGTNMAYRKEIFEKYGGIRTDLGPCPGSEIRSEDTEFGRRLLKAGELLRYEPSAVVYHEVPQHRLTKKYFLAWFFDKGRADVREFGASLDTKYCVSGVPLYLFRRFAVWTLRRMIALEPSQRFSCRLKTQWLLGGIVESHRQSSELKRQGEKFEQRERPSSL
jgi:glycosyltransferase involved in cell wall biosynthesis